MSLIERDGRRLEKRRGSVLALVLVVLAAGSVHGQEPTRSNDAMPFADYVVRLDELQAATDIAFIELGPDATPARIATAFGDVLELATSDLADIRRTVAPEPCYATAHERITAYRESVIELLSAVLPEMAESETIDGVKELIEQVDAALYARHPSAYTEPPGNQPGFGGSHRNVLAALATCGLDVDEVLGRPTDLIEFPEAGVAVTLPAEWQPLPVDIASQAGEQMLGTYFSTRHGICGVGVVTSTPATLQDVIDFFVPAGYWNDLAEGFEADQVETAAGPGVRVRYWEQRDDLDTRYWNAIYAIPTELGVFSVQCTAGEGEATPPADDWLAIVETFTVLAAGPSESPASPAAYGGDQ